MSVALVTLAVCVILEVGSDEGDLVMPRMKIVGPWMVSNYESGVVRYLAVCPLPTL